MNISNEFEISCIKQGLDYNEYKRKHILLNIKSICFSKEQYYDLKVKLNDGIN